MSQADLAEKAGTLPRQIRRYEAGEVQPSFAQAKAIADALEISLDELAGGVPFEGITGTWWIAWKEIQDANPIITQVHVSHAGSDYQAQPLDPEDETSLDPRWRLTFKRERDEGLLGWFVDSHTIGVAVLQPMSPGWAGRWVGVPKPERPAAGHVALSRTQEQLAELLEAAVEIDARRSKG